MTLEFKKGTYISRIWFVHHPGLGVDVQGSLWRELPDGLWHFDYRFRYYSDDHAHDSRDRKSGYQTTFREALSEAEVVGKLAVAWPSIAEMLGDTYGTPPWEIDCCEIGTDEPADVVRLLSLKPWAHMKLEPEAS